MRKTYTDNNGFLRYEDNCKIVQNQPDNKKVLSELYNTFNVKTKNLKYNYTYDELNYIEGRCINDAE